MSPAALEVSPARPQRTTRGSQRPANRGAVSRIGDCTNITPAPQQAQHGSRLPRSICGSNLPGDKIGRHVVDAFGGARLGDCIQDEEPAVGHAGIRFKHAGIRFEVRPHRVGAYPGKFFSNQRLRVR